MATHAGPQPAPPLAGAGGIGYWGFWGTLSKYMWPVDHSGDLRGADPRPLPRSGCYMAAIRRHDSGIGQAYWV